MYNAEEQENTYSIQEKNASVLLNQIRSDWECLLQPTVSVEKITEIKSSINNFRNEHEYYYQGNYHNNEDIALLYVGDKYGEWFLAINAEMRLLEFKVKLNENKNNKRIISPSSIPSEDIVKNLSEFYSRNPIDGAIPPEQISDSLKEILIETISADFDPDRKFHKSLNEAYDELRLDLYIPNPFSDHPDKPINLYLLSDHDFEEVVKKSTEIFSTWAKENHISFDARSLPQTWEDEEHLIENTDYLKKLSDNERKEYYLDRINTITGTRYYMGRYKIPELSSVRSANIVLKELNRLKTVIMETEGNEANVAIKRIDGEIVSWEKKLDVNSKDV